ncbi:hypothetical protein D3C87_1772130 [compost metagenome]
MEFAGGIRIECQVKLVFPSKLEPGLAQCIVAVLRPRMPFGQIGRMRCNLIGDYPIFYIFFIRQAQMFFRRYVAQHGRAKPANHSSTNGRSDVVVTRCNISGQRP